MSNSLRSHGLWPIMLLCLWDFPGKNTGVGYHSLLQGIFLRDRTWVSRIAGKILCCLSHHGSLLDFYSWVQIKSVLTHPSPSTIPCFFSRLFTQSDFFFLSFNLLNTNQGLPWWSSGQESSLQCRGQRFDSWWGFPGGWDSKESACNSGDLGSTPGSGRSPGEGNGNRLPYSCLGNPMDREAWRATVHGTAKSRTPLSDWHFHFFRGTKIP